MNVSCSADMCPVILDSTCVFYSGGNLIYTGINTNDNLQTVIIKINNKFKDAGLGYVFNNGLTQAVPGDPVQLGGPLVKNTIITNSGFTFTFTETIEAASFITTGGTSSQFVKGDGSLDSISYQPSGNYITALTGDGTASGPGSSIFTLTNVNPTFGTWGSTTQVPVITTDAKGRITNITTASIYIPSDSLSFGGDLSGFGTTGTLVNLTLNTVNSNVYITNTPLKFAVNAKGLVTSAAPLTNIDIDGIYGYTPIGDAPINGNTYGRKNGGWVTVGSSAVTWGSITGTITAQTDLITYLSTNYYPVTNPAGYITSAALAPYLTSATAASTYVPQTRTITINGTTYDLSADRSWTVSGLPSQATHAGQWLTTDGTNASWASLPPSGVSAVTASTPLFSSGGSTPNITIQQASGSQSGYLSSTDWTTFNSKQNAITLTTTGTSGAATFISNTLNIPQYQAVLTNPVTGTGVATRVAFWDGTSSLSSNANLYWDNINSWLGISNTVPIAPIDLGSGTGTAGSISKIALYSSIYGTYGFGISAAQLDYVSGGSHVFYRNSPTTDELFRIGNTGTLTAVSLAGSGTRMVTADSSGTLSTQTIPSFTSPLTTKGDIYVRNSTVDTRLPVGLDTQILLADSTTATGLKWGTNTAATPLGYYGAFSDITNQTAAVINTGYPMLLGVTDLSNGVTVVSGSRVTIANTGIYNIQWSAQFTNPTASEHDVTIWLRKNGVDVAGSAGVVLVPAKHGSADGHTLPSWNFLLDVVGGDYYEFVWSTANTSVYISFAPAGSPPPSTASVVLTVTQQSGIMAGTGITAINSLTGAVQTLTTGTSGLAPLFTSTGTTHTLDIPLASTTGVTAGLLSNTDYNNFGTRAAGGSFVAYYFNGSIPASVATYYQMSPTANIAAAANFTLAGNGLISQWLTDAGNPNRIEIPAGNWNFEMYMSASSAGGTPAFYVELLKYNGGFTSIASSVVTPKNITGGTSIDLYLTSLAIPQTTLLVTDRLAIRVYIVNNVPGRSITFYTQDTHISEVITNFAGGISALNGLTVNTQYFATGTSGTDFNISSTSATHTFNLPTASATNRGVLSTSDWTNFNTAYTNRITSLTTTGTSGAATLVGNTLNIPQYSGGSSYTFSTGLTNTSGTVTSNLSTGISGGQSVIGGTAASNSLTLSSTSNATKGKILFGTSAYDEVNNRLGIGTASPTYPFHLSSSVTASSGSAISSQISPTLVAAANSDVLIGLDINPTFTNGSFTGVKNYALKLNNSSGISSNYDGTLTYYAVDATRTNSGIVSIFTPNGSPSGFGYVFQFAAQGTSLANSLLFIGGNASAVNNTANKHLITTSSDNGASARPLAFRIAPANQNWGAVNDQMTIFSTGNVVISNSSASATDAGYKLDVNGTARIQGATTISTGNVTVSSGNVNITGNLTATNSNVNNNCISHSAQIVGGNNTANAQSYRLTNGGTSIDPQGMFGSVNATAGTITCFADNTNGFTIGAGNGTRMIGRAGINIASLTNTAGSESGDLIFLTQSSGTAMAERMRINSIGNVLMQQNLSVVSCVKGGSSTIGGATYRLVNGGSNLQPQGAFGNPDANAVGFPSVLIDMVNNNGLLFTSPNGVTNNRIARAAINITNLGNTAGSESGDMIFLTQSGGTAMSEKMRITSGGGITLTATNTASGTTGNQTINKPSGTVNIAAAGTTVTVTNSLVTASSIVFAVIRTNDATATIKNVVPAAGSFVINLASATTAETSIGFFVIN